MDLYRYFLVSFFFFPLSLVLLLHVSLQHIQHYKMVSNKKEEMNVCGFHTHEDRVKLFRIQKRRKYKTFKNLVLLLHARLTFLL